MMKKRIVTILGVVCLLSIMSTGCSEKPKDEPIIEKDKTDSEMMVIEEGDAQLADNHSENQEEQIIEDSYVSDAYTSFQVATNLTENDLDGTYYEDLKLIQDDIDWLNNPANTEGTVEDGALYRKIGGLLWGNSSERGHNQGWEIASKYVLGYVAEDYGFYLPYAQNATKYFLFGDYSLDDVVSPLLDLDSVVETGKRDPSCYEYHFCIPDLKACAEEMQVTEKALGYLLAQLNESGANITIEKNSFTFDSGTLAPSNSSSNSPLRADGDHFVTTEADIISLLKSSIGEYLEDEGNSNYQIHFPLEGDLDGIDMAFKCNNSNQVELIALFARNPLNVLATGNTVIHYLDETFDVDAISVNILQKSARKP